MENMNPYYEEVKKDKRAAQEQMVLLSMAGFADKLKLYEEALELVEAEEAKKEKDAVSVRETKKVSVGKKAKNS